MSDLKLPSINLPSIMGSPTMSTAIFDPTAEMAPLVRKKKGRKHRDKDEGEGSMDEAEEKARRRRRKEKKKREKERIRNMQMQEEEGEPGMSRSTPGKTRCETCHCHSLAIHLP